MLSSSIQVEVIRERERDGEREKHVRNTHMYLNKEKVYLVNCYHTHVYIHMYAYTVFSQTWFAECRQHCPLKAHPEKKTQFLSFMKVICFAAIQH